MTQVVEEGEFALAEAYVRMLDEEIWLGDTSLEETLRMWRNSLTLAMGDEKGISGLSWFEDFGDLGQWSLWLRVDVRGTRQGLRFVQDSIDTGLEAFPSLTVLTTQPKVSRMAQRLGFHKLAEIDKIHKGKKGFLLQRSK